MTDFGVMDPSLYERSILIKENKSGDYSINFLEKGKIQYITLVDKVREDNILLMNEWLLGGNIEDYERLL